MKILASLSIWIALVLTLGCEVQSDANEQVQQSNAFVQVEGSQFRLNGKPYYFAGTNMWYGAYLGSTGDTGNQARLIKELDILKARGITNLRILAVSESSESQRAVRPAIITSSAGALDSALLEGLDFLLAEMAKRNMKAVLYLNNFWQWSGGMSQYVSWITGDPAVDPDVTGKWNEFMENSARFYRMPKAQTLYRSVIKKIITRTNTITGVAYNNDPTIMAWQLANEPRPGSDAVSPEHAEYFIAWIEGSAKYIKSLAPKQLLSTGNEGYMGSAQNLKLFEDSHASPYIDYLTFHMWIKNWGWFDVLHAEETYDSALVNATKYLQQHVDLAARMNKPIVLEEFGIERDGGIFDVNSPVVYRDRFYTDMFSYIYDHAKNNGVFAGSNFWAWGGAGRTHNADYMWRKGDDFVGDPPQEAQGLNSVFDADSSTLSVIEAHAVKMQNLRGL